MNSVTLPPGQQARFPGQNLIGFFRDPLDYLTNAAHTYGDVVDLGFRQAKHHTFLLSHPDDIRDVLVTNHRKFTKSAFLKRARVFLGDGLLTSENDLHLRQRRLMQPAFHHQRIATYGNIMVENALQTIRPWQDGATIDLSHELMNLTMLIVAQALFGADLQCRSEAIGQAITEIILHSNRLGMPFYETIQRLPLPSNRRIEQAGLYIDQVIQSMIEQRRQTGEAREDLLDMMLSARDEQGDGQGMSDKLIRDETLTLFLAGHETTANALTWTFYMISEHPWVEQKLHEELEQVLAGRAPMVDDLDRLVYTRMVIREAMRHRPPVWVVGREAIEDYPVRGYVLPAGSVILMSQWVVHHDRRFYRNPKRFDPERWQPEAAKDLPRFAYFPFGGGPRVCIGESFAWMEATLLLATIAQKWQMRLATGERADLLPRVTLRPRGGMKMVLFQRD